jgi:hypothetical protein
MPKRNQKNAVNGSKVQLVAAGTNEDFDDMLAEVRAMDVTAQATATDSRPSSRL